jgi:hypothetical protein
VPEAVPTLRRLAEEGDAVAQADLAHLYIEGKGVERDYVTAMKWARRAADAGNAIGEHNVGHLFETGLGVPQDLSAAALWFARAAEHSHDPAMAALRRLASKGVAEATDAVKRLGLA